MICNDQGPPTAPINSERPVSAERTASSRRVNTRMNPDANVTSHSSAEPAGPYTMDSTSRDKSDGPTHQPGAAPGYVPLRGQPTEYAPFRSPREHNETDLDLHLNKARDGVPFGTQEETEGSSIHLGAPSAANRELPVEMSGCKVCWEDQASWGGLGYAAR